MCEMLVHFLNIPGNLSYNSLFASWLVYSVIILPQWTVIVWVAMETVYVVSREPEDER